MSRSFVDRSYAGIYFAVQSARGGVDRSMIDAAAAVLETSREEQRQRALSRLRSIHGPDLTWEEFERRPLTDRASLASRARSLVERSDAAKVEVRKTSGSTGAPFVFAKSKSMTAWMDAAMWAVYRWHGVEPGLPHARFWGMPLGGRKRLKTRLFDHFLHRHRIGAFDLDEGAAVRHFRRLRKLKPTYAYGYPTVMRAFADLLRQQGIAGTDLGFDVVISTGELLTEETAEDLSTFFGCRVVNEYGCTESGILAFTCEQGSMHTVPVAVLPEIVPRDGAMVDPGDLGEVLASDLFGEVMPLTRYRLGDRGRWAEDGCACGRDLPVIDIQTGRIDSFILTPRGPVYDAILAYSVPPEVLRFRAHQTQKDRIEAEIVVAEGQDARAVADRCEARWREVLGGGLRIDVRPVPAILPEPSGKLRYFVPLEASREPEANG